MGTWRFDTIFNQVYPICGIGVEPVDTQQKIVDSVFSHTHTKRKWVIIAFVHNRGQWKVTTLVEMH